MMDWFENFSKQYFKEKYDYYYLYDHNKELHTYKNIHSVKIKENVLSGYISHGKYDSNRIKIKFKTFDDDELEKLNKIIDENPINRFKIINKTLPDDLLRTEIKILPESLDELEIECSYDDEEENLIDVLSILKEFNKRLMKNNFLIFKIRGLNLTRTITYPVKTLDDILEFKFKTVNDDVNLINLHDANKVLLKNMENPNTSFDFIYNELFELLNEEINNITKNNMTTLYVNYDNEDMVEFKSIEEKDKHLLEKWDVKSEVNINIDDDYNITNTDQFNNSQKLFTFLNEINITRIKCNEKIIFLKQLLELTYTLVRNYSIMPEIFKTEKSYNIRWIPSFYSSNVINYCKKYYGKCPDNLVTLNNEPLSNQNQVIILISLFMNALITYTVQKNQIKDYPYISNVVFKLFTGEKLNRENDRYQITAENISKQLSVFYLNEQTYSYEMFIDENFCIEIKIREKDTIKNITEANLDELKNISKIYDLFNYYKIKNTIYEKIRLKNKDFIIFHNNIINLLPLINVKLNKPFQIIGSKIDLILDIKTKTDDFQLKNLKNYYYWKIRLEDTEIKLKHFDTITDDMNEIIKIEDKIYLVDGPSFRHIKQYTWTLLQKDESNEILQYAILEEYIGLKFKLSENFKKLIKTSNIYEQPQTLKGKLRPYQKIGYSWLIQNIKSGFGSILADDMGLGKTLQVLAAILYFKENSQLESNTSLIIVPPTLLSNWQREIEKFTPELSYYIYHGTNRIFPTQHYDIILTSYAIIRSDLEMFINEFWFICVLDEAQNIKNPSTQQTIAIKEVYAFNKIALTGTPVENRLTDYWSIFDFVNKGYLSSLEDFKTKYVTPIEKLGDEETLNNLKTIAKPFVMRRLKSDDEIRNELPEKFVNDIYCSLTKKQVNLYNNLLKGNFEKIIDTKGIERKGSILKLITALKQTCNHPAQYLKYEKMKINESGKMELLANLLENILDMNEKVLIFTQYVEMGKIIKELISRKFKTEVLFLHGTLSRKEKSRIIDTFQENPDYKILVATLKTGGTGLNLTAAQNVIHYDLWWNPAVENQATDRVHRIGQENDVMVYRFITKGTLEESIDQMVKNKIDLANKTISTDKTFITELTNEELKELLKLRL
ncbi:DEAD/DEAH box helicase [Methanosphaera sp. ISO3-F5]|uniref:DEAD/DEAH box helicase n=1 Tax=Methanosphaera sp. ISO3-F5 TaxID=1452353 RepID=UPI002B25720C|nr:DEAD/DEAH box helicase [Methanosphaera sp. ISO3-F5]WQH64402.1 DEAD/DEAH box helicase [Methanosphaera sp. ISO3-F5]